MKKLSKELYIDTTYDLLMRDGQEGVGIRSISKALGVSSTSLYRHFDNLDHLVMYVNLRFLKPYIRAIKAMDKEYIYSIEGYFKMWELFAEYSYERPDIYKSIFFENTSYKLSSIFEEYYNMFEEELFNIDSENKEWLVSGDIYSRSFKTLKNAMSDYTISDDVIKNVAEIHVYIYFSILNKMLLENKSTKLYKDEFMEKINFVFNEVVKK